MDAIITHPSVINVIRVAYSVSIDLKSVNRKVAKNG